MSAHISTKVKIFFKKHCKEKEEKKKKEKEKEKNQKKKKKKKIRKKEKERIFARKILIQKKIIFALTMHGAWFQY